jgi:hypothetical protein
VHASTVLGIVSAKSSANRSPVRQAQLGESVASTIRRVRTLDGVGQQVDDVLLSPEVGEVFEREVDGADHPTGAAQVTEFVELSLSAAHAGDDPPAR